MVVKEIDKSRAWMHRANEKALHKGVPEAVDKKGQQLFC
jgi:hypothetical protein